MLFFIPLVNCHCPVNIHVILEEIKWIQAKYHQLSWINSLISLINSALENCSSSKRIEARTNLREKGNHLRLFRRLSFPSAQFYKSYHFLKNFSGISQRFLISTFLKILRICIHSKQLQPKIMKHTSKQLKEIWLELVLNIQLNKRKLSKQQKAAATYMAFCSYHYTEMWWTRGYQRRFIACGPPRGCVWSSLCWCKIIKIVWREGAREEGKEGERRRKTEKMVRGEAKVILN